ncbi:SDR family oxidoreductase [Bradyrhizobium sp. SYSU BS000235]|uniref:SDR family oxidoreductase n=1 Tax=Bradyrhizobium sp. SYSU BS000235 TaxID=3411332 RepID=UPI003C785ACA
MTRTVLITGTSSGLGRETAERLARDGYRVFATMRDVASRNRSHADALRSRKISVVELDVTDDGSIDRAIALILAEARKIDVLVNNAGMASVGVTEAFTADQTKAIFDTNVIGLLRVTRAVLPSMRRERDGLIINMGSVLGRVTFPFVGIYCASKMAIEALTDSLRLEVSQLGIDVVEVQPGAYPTSLYSSIQRPADDDITKSYGELGQIPDAIHKTYTTMLQGEDAPKLHEVAEAVAKLIGQAKGSRAVRTVVGMSFGADRINAEVAPIQKALVDGLGLGHLEELA